MKIWTKVHIRNYDNGVFKLAKALTNYIYCNGPINDISNKYNITSEDKKILDQYTANRIAGLLMLYLSKDTKRINDIANKYNIENANINDLLPEIEGYVNR